MGQRLSTEILDFVGEYCPGSLLDKISFIGHSLGGIIARASLQHLPHFRHKAHLYISLSSPHLGYKGSKSSLVSAGMWILKTIGGGDSIKQLSFADAPNIRDSYLYKLSFSPEISWFQHVIFVGSKQDTYVTYESAILNSEAMSPELRCMERAILANLSTPVLYKLEACFDSSESRSIDRMIGRDAHIQPIDNE